jgi:hypothetical protein
MKKAILIALIIFLFSSFSIAEPSKSFKYLMDEPISMLDWCCYQIGKVIEEMDFTSYSQYFTDPYFDVQYNWNSNLIVATIKCRISPDKFEYLEPRSLSKRIVESIKWSLLAIEFSDFLGHNGYKRLSEPASLIEDVENNLKISVSLLSTYGNTSTSSVPKNHITCESLLKSNEYSYKFPEK